MMSGGKALFCSSLLLLQQILTCAANQKDNGEACRPSSCGKISNVKHPFRLKDDPATCGDEVSKGVNEPYGTLQYRVFVNGSTTEEDLIRVFEHVIFLNCSNPIKDDPRFMDTAPCIEKGNHHVYAVVGGLKAVELRDDCRVKMVAASSFLGPPQRNLSYGEIHRRLSYGFDLSWMLGGACASTCEELDLCSFNETAQRLICTDLCGSPTGVQCNFAYGILKGTTPHSLMHTSRKEVSASEPARKPPSANDRSIQRHLFH